ncbi:uncharacterized protein LOC131658147 [Vicia villosa]|uniref:uncharacterized protein LOC131658147 n=1 Tax=Vicia villosa TaxID=3911 RepID=UPI00273B9932|nr:uncharacterized protein LOC131658147 [Vicia villosa]
MAEIVEKIQRVSLRVDTKDSWRWHKSVYTTKDAYSLIMEGLVTHVGDDKELVAVWSKLIPPKVSVLAWRVWQNRIPTRDNLVKRGILVDSQNSCPFGSGEEESVAHIFFECSLAWNAWSEVLRWLGFLYVSHNSALQNFNHFAVITSTGRVLKTDLPSFGLRVFGQFGKGGTRRFSAPLIDVEIPAYSIFRRSLRNS